MQQIIEKTKEHNVALFIDKEKAYGNGNRDKMWGMVGNKISNYLLNTQYSRRRTNTTSEPITNM